jgi:hypothetical protein
MLQPIVHKDIVKLMLSQGVDHHYYMCLKNTIVQA